MRARHRPRPDARDSLLPDALIVVVQGGRAIGLVSTSCATLGERLFRELWTEGGHHLIGGLEFDRKGLLWAFNDHSVIHVDSNTGRQLPLAAFPPRAFYSTGFARDGSVYLGEHRNAKDPPTGIEKYTTIKMLRTPDTNVLGYGNIYKFNAAWELEQEFEVENAPNRQAL